MYISSDIVPVNNNYFHISVRQVIGLGYIYCLFIVIINIIIIIIGVIIIIIIY
mgnify:CR=1 FL=1